MSTFDLAGFSDAVADLAQAAAPAVASVDRGRDLTASAFHWRDGLFVTAEEALEDGDDCELTLVDGATLKGTFAGRDPSTGIALIRTAVTGLPVFSKADLPRAGALAVAVGRGNAILLASFGSVGAVGPAWRSMRGGAIAARMNLAIHVGGRFEGGPVLDARGALLGMLLFGPRRRVLVMPFENVEKAVVQLAAKGHVARGYLGAGLHPLRHGAVHGAIIMSLDDEGPARAAGLQLGDIIVAFDGEPVHGPRGLMGKLGPDSVGTTVTLGILRGGVAQDVALTIGEKPLG